MKPKRNIPTVLPVSVPEMELLKASKAKKQEKIQSEEKLGAHWTDYWPLLRAASFDPQLKEVKSYHNGKKINHYALTTGRVRFYMYVPRFFQDMVSKITLFMFLSA